MTCKVLHDLAGPFLYLISHYDHLIHVISGTHTDPLIVSRICQVHLGCCIRSFIYIYIERESTWNFLHPDTCIVFSLSSIKSLLSCRLLSESFLHGSLCIFNLLCLIFLLCPYHHLMQFKFPFLFCLSLVPMLLLVTNRV